MTGERLLQDVVTEVDDPPVDDVLNGQHSSQALERGLAILSAVANGSAALGIVDLARCTDLSKSTVHRYVGTLVRLGFLEQDESTRKYRVGHHAVELGFAAVGSMDVASAAARPLQMLADETGYTANLAILDGPDIIYINRRRPVSRSASRLELSTQVGTRLPAYCTSMGKVLLAFSEPARVRAVLDRTDLVRLGPKTITAREELLRELRLVARTGIAVNDEELAPGLRSIAAPVLDAAGQVCAAANLAIHFGAWNTTMDAVQRRLGPPLLRCAEEVSKRLGYVSRAGAP